MTETGTERFRVGGFESLSFCDWPGEIVATVFAQGCPWDCPYCHNPHLLPAIGSNELDWTDLLGFLETRRGLLDGVVFSGGEPTLQRGLGAAIANIRTMGYRIGLHSGGPYPQRLAAILPLVDWVGFDIKAAFTDYDRITRVPGSGLKARKSLELVLESGVDYELRTTIDPSLLDDKAVAMIGAELAAYGIVSHKLQKYRPIGIRAA
ncbi:anaerobic ribonucleoside-triphosphate reductase activating protein [Aliirhizobium smilacinae]|uniref:anaerobic ribonucleoside-triphosphate reductase activating protein n=1 Tax=Aliirhizobium smilacinae TaxID=1395944 RepID=UPI001AEE4A7F|nr:anaerobic ribonucleoside-triphosphate reductase activating protein [Rhizobium smilacinae]